MGCHRAFWHFGLFCFGRTVSCLEILFFKPNRVVDQKYSSGIEEFTAGMFLEEGKVIFLYIGNIGEFLHVITLISTAKVQFHV